jgi:hypothetical protein
MRASRLAARLIVLASNRWLWRFVILIIVITNVFGFIVLRSQPEGSYLLKLTALLDFNLPFFIVILYYTADAIALSAITSLAIPNRLIMATWWGALSLFYGLFSLFYITRFFEELTPMVMAAMVTVGMGNFVDLFFSSAFWEATLSHVIGIIALLLNVNARLKDPRRHARS